MSDIERFVTIWGGGGMMPATNGNYVRYDDHRAEVERVMADVVKLRIDLNSAQVAANQQRGEVERLTARQTEMETHITGLTSELHRTRGDGIKLRWVQGKVEQLTAQRDAAQAEVERLKNTLFPWDTYDRLKNANEHLKEDVAKLTVDRDAAQAEVERLTQELDGRRATNQRIIAERDLAQGERERLQDLLRCERQELSTLRERLRQLRSDQPAQNLDMGNGQATLDTSRPDDETIWREAFMRFIEEKNAVECADIRLAEYRKRWPR